MRIKVYEDSEINKSVFFFFVLLSDYWQRKDLQYLTWFDRLALSLNKILNTHLLEINLKELTEAYVENMRRKGKITSNILFNLQKISFVLNTQSCNKDSIYENVSDLFNHLQKPSKFIIFRKISPSLLLFTYEHRWG